MNDEDISPKEKEYQDDLKEGFYQPPAEPESIAETTRKTGMAYSAGLTLGASVIVMLLIGMAADYFFKSSPVGLICGLILGAVVGFYQFFKITSQIFKK